MKTKYKEVNVKGVVRNEASGEARTCNLKVIYINDERGKFLSVGNGLLQFRIPIEPLEEYIKGECKK